MKHNLPVFALLIDADNVNKVILPIIEEVTPQANRRAPRLWRLHDAQSDRLARNACQSRHPSHPTAIPQLECRQNASDSALIIDAMDLLHSRRFEGFCLVSSDGDFTRLATRIREDGAGVFGLQPERRR